MNRIFIYGDPEKRQNYAEALKAAGAAPIVTANLSLAADCQALLIPGGADLDPALYGAENRGSQGIRRQLDDTELALIRQFAAAGRPILGICRGLQAINVAFGGDLIQHLPTASAHCWEESTGDKQHLVQVEADSFLAGIYPDCGGGLSVNSAHHQGAGRVAEGFRVAARARDGVVEALECPRRNIFAVQWHPERMTLGRARSDTVDGLGIFRFFVGLTAER